MSTNYYHRKLAEMTDDELCDEYKNKLRDYKQRSGSSGKQSALQFLNAVWGEAIDRHKPELAERAAQQLREELRRKEQENQATLNQLESEWKQWETN